MSEHTPPPSAALAAAVYLGQAAARPASAGNGNWPRARFTASLTGSFNARAATHAPAPGASAAAGASGSPTAPPSAPAPARALLPRLPWRTRASPTPGDETIARAQQAAPTQSRWRLPTPAWLLGLLLPAALLASAEAAVRTGLLAPNLLPPPSAILETISELAQRGLANHVAASTVRVAIGFAAGALAAILLGAATALHRPTHALLDPTVQALRAIPSLAWVPLLLLWLGIDEAPKLVLIAIGAFFPVYMGVASGIRGVDRKLVEVARLYRLTPIAQARQVLLPAALPAILTGLRNGLGLAWMFMVAAELIAASKGLGYLLSDGRETSRADIVLAAILLLAVLGKASDSLMLRLEQRLLAWRDSFESPRHA